MKKTLKGIYKGYNKEADLIEFVASTDAIDREGESIDPGGWDLTNVGKNLPLLWAHEARFLPIGKVVEAYVDGNSLVTAVEFAHKIDEFAKRVYNLVKAGFLNAVSVGFMPKAYDAQGKMVSQELLELSVVNVPANQEALRSNEYRAFIKSLDKLGDKEEEKEKQKKEGRIISEKNRNTVRIAIDAMGQAQSALSDLLNATEPPAKKGGVKNNEPVKKPAGGTAKRIYKSVQIMDKLGEAIIHELKEGGEIK